MALRLIEGFDDGLLSYKGWTVSTLRTAAGRFGGSCISTWNGANYRYTFGTPLTGTLTVGFAMLRQQATTLYFVDFGLLRLQGEAGGQITIRRTDNSAQVAISATTPLSTSNAWRFIEFQYTPTTGACEVRVDGVAIMTATLPTSANVSSIYFPDVGGNVVTYDDLYVLDTSGTTNVTYLGDVRVQTIYPSADGSNNDMTPSTGTSHASLVDEPAANTTDYVSTSTVGAKDSYQYQDLAANTANVFGVQATAYGRKDATGPIGLRNITRIAGANYSGAQTYPLSPSWTAGTELWNVNPATSSGWTPSEVNNAEFGIETV